MAKPTSKKQVQQVVSKSMVRNGSKIAICEDCGKESTVRKDTNPKVCKLCASSRGGRAAKGVFTAEMKECKGCKKQIRKSLNQNYCTSSCRSINNREERECKKCNKPFTILKSALKTNASGNFCSRHCYELFLCKSGRTTGRGSQWKKIRDQVVVAFPFCAVCGTTKKLQVHHIIPFRLTHDNSKENLIPLCVTHHKAVEYSFVKTEHEEIDIQTQSIFWRATLRARQILTIRAIKGIYNAS